MGEAKDREKLQGYLTVKEQVLLGVMLVNHRAGDASQKDGHRQDRRQRRAALDALGLGFVADRIEERSDDPKYEGKRLFDPEELTDERKPFAISRDVLAYVLEQLDSMPLTGVNAQRLLVIEDRLSDVKAGDFKMPPELVADATDPPEGGSAAE